MHYKTNNKTTVTKVKVLMQSDHCQCYCIINNNTFALLFHSEIKSVTVSIK